MLLLESPSAVVKCVGVNEADFKNGAPVAGTNTMSFTKEALVSYQDATHYAAMGKVGTFYGLYVKGGAVYLESSADANNAVFLDGSGLRGKKAGATIFDLNLAQMKPGMVLVEDVRNRAGVLLVARGYTVSQGLLARLQNLAPTIKEPIKVIVPAVAATAPK